MIDPINDFEIPEKWIKRCNIPYDVLKEGIENGKLILLPSGDILRRGYTTGTTAAAASKAAVLSLHTSDIINRILVPTPIGIKVELEVSSYNGKAVATKYAGDHEFDITNGIEIVANAYTLATQGFKSQSKLIKIIAGDGIGIKDNKPAISPTAWNQIYSAISEALQITQETGAEVYLEVPNGAEIAKKTQNEKVGVIGGISILGTTGFVEPWNDSMDKLINERIKNADKIVLTTGHLGIKYSRALFPDYTVIMVGSHLEKALQWTCDKEVIICGLPGLILKSTNPDLLKRTTVQELMQNSELIDTALAYLVKGASPARVILLNRDGSILRDTSRL